MALKGREKFNTDLSISITGNAGPSVEEGKAKVGEAYVGLSDINKTISVKLLLDGERNEIREKAVEVMAKLLIDFCN